MADTSKNLVEASTVTPENTPPPENGERDLNLFSLENRRKSKKKPLK